MKPKLLEAPPAGGDWIYELKFDGIRLIAVKNGEKVNLISRNGNELASEISGSRRSGQIVADRGLRDRWRGRRVGRKRRLVFSAASGARNGGPAIADLLLCVRSAAGRWEKPDWSAA